MGTDTKVPLMSDGENELQPVSTSRLIDELLPVPAIQVAASICRLIDRQPI